MGIICRNYMLNFKPVLVNYCLLDLATILISYD